MAKDGKVLEIDRAVDFLKSVLAGGKWLPKKDVTARAHDEGISDATLRKAREQLNVDTNPRTVPGARRPTSHWHLPARMTKPTARGPNKAFEEGFRVAMSLAEAAACKVIDANVKIGTQTWTNLRQGIHRELKNVESRHRSKPLK